jgi:hypothetical protein
MTMNIACVALGVAVLSGSCRDEPKATVTFMVVGVSCRARVEYGNGNVGGPTSVEREVQTPWQSEPIAMPMHGDAHLRVWIDPSCATDPRHAVSVYGT